MRTIFTMLVLLFVASCTKEDDVWTNTQTNTNTSTTSESNDDNSTTTDSGDDVINGVSSDGDVTSFSIAFNKNAISESFG